MHRLHEVLCRTYLLLPMVGSRQHVLESASCRAEPRQQA